MREMAALAAARGAVANENVEAVIERIGGVPLFVEELAHSGFSPFAMHLPAA